MQNIENLTETLIATFGLQPHPEGGWYKETYRSNVMLQEGCLPADFAAQRVLSTAIYFLLEQGNFSAFHRIKSDECWHFYAGHALEIFVISPDGDLSVTRLGSDFTNAESFQFVVPANCWFASRPAPGSACCFVGCTVAPGFSFDDFELATAAELTQQYPEHAPLIRELCRQ